jgi:hypothetical protein
VVSFTLLSTAVGVWVWSLRSPSSITITPQSFSEAYSYEISVEGFTYYAKNGTTGQVDYSSANSTTVFSQAIAASDNGSSIYIKSGTYGQIFLNKDVSLIGEGISTTPAAYPSDPDDMITGMSGVVISITTANTNALMINGTRSNINIKNIGIHFSGSGTGYGVYSSAGNNIQGLMYSSLDNIFVWGHDASHYAFWFVNMQHCTLDRLYSFGGPAVHMETESSLWTMGIAEIGLLYARVPSTCTMTKSTFEFIGNSSTCLVGGMKIVRLHCMDRSGSNTVASLYIHYGSTIDIRELDIENANNQIVTLDHCNQVNIYNGLMLGGGITHTNCAFCGYWAGYINASSTTTDSGSDFMGSEVQLVTSGTMNFTRGQHEASYIIYKLGSMYYAEDGTNGQNYVWSTDAEYVFSVVVAAVNANGAVVAVQPASYTFTSTLLINKTGIIFQGPTSSEGTAGLFLASGVSVPLLNITGDYTTFRDMTIYGNYGSTADTLAINAGHLLFDRVTFSCSKRYLVSMTGGDDNVFRDCVFTNANKYGAYVKDATYATFDTVQFRTIGAGSSLTDVAGIAFNGSCIGCSVINSKFNFIDSNVGGVHYGYGIEELGANMINMKYIGNSGYGIPLGLSSHLISNSVTFKENTYYHTGGLGDREQPTGTSESSGSLSNNTATTFRITHGLFGMPTGVWCSFNNTAVLSYSWTATSSIITVTVTGAALPAAMTCYWSAEYRP